MTNNSVGAIVLKTAFLFGTESSGHFFHSRYEWRYEGLEKNISQEVWDFCKQTTDTEDIV